MRRVLAVIAFVTIGLISGTFAAQAKVIVNVSEPFASVVFVPCANSGVGEFVDLSGELHVLVTLTIDANTVSGVAHFQPQGVRGLGETTGDVYEGTGVTREQFTTSFLNDRAETSFVNSFQVIGRGGVGSFRVHETSHLTIAAGGDVEGVVEHATVDCR